MGDIDFSKIECIIPFKLSTADRYENLCTVLKYFKLYFKDIKITIVEQDLFNKVRLNNVLFIKSDKPFNKGWILNCAAKKSDKDYLLFWDADMIVKPKFVEIAIASFIEFDAIKPYNEKEVFDVMPAQTALFKKTINFECLNNLKVRTGCPYGGGIFGIKKEKMFEIGGYFEDFSAWGCEDTAISIKIERFLKHTNTSNPGYHLFHTRNIFDKAYHELYNKNIEFLENYIKMPNDVLLQKCKEDKDKIGTI